MIDFQSKLSIMIPNPRCKPGSKLKDAPLFLDNIQLVQKVRVRVGHVGVKESREISSSTPFKVVEDLKQDMLPRSASAS